MSVEAFPNRFLYLRREVVLPFILGPQTPPSTGIVAGSQATLLCHVFQYIGPFEEGKALCLGFGRDVAAVLAIVAQGFLHFHHTALLGQQDIEEPVAAETHVLVAVALRGLELVATEDTFADIGDGVADGQFPVDEVNAAVVVDVVAIGCFPEFCALLANPPGGCVGQHAVGHLAHFRHQPFQEGGFGIVVALSHPYPPPLCQCYSLVPLTESAAAIGLVEDDVACVWIAAVLLHHLAASIRRAVVQQYELEVLVGLCQNAVDALFEKRRMVVVGHYDRDGGHGYQMISVAFCSFSVNS